MRRPIIADRFANEDAETRSKIILGEEGRGRGGGRMPSGGGRGWRSPPHNTAAAFDVAPSRSQLNKYSLTSRPRRFYKLALFALVRKELSPPPCSSCSLPPSTPFDPGIRCFRGGRSNLTASKLFNDSLETFAIIRVNRVAND